MRHITETQPSNNNKLRQSTGTLTQTQFPVVVFPYYGNRKYRKKQKKEIQEDTQRSKQHQRKNTDETETNKRDDRDEQKRRNKHSEIT
jgi:hypothetical protein